MIRALKRVPAALNRLSVGAQLSAAFGVVLLLTATIGAMSLWATWRIDASAEALNDKWLKGVGLLAQARAALVEAREFEIKYSRATDKSYMSEYDEKHSNAAKAAEAALQGYAALPAANADEQKLSATAAKAWEGYRKAAQRVLQLGRDKKQQDAADISDGMASMAVDEAMGAIDHLSTFNFKHAEQASQHANVVYQRTRNGMLALLAVALLSGLGLAVWFTRRLLRQLGGQPSEAVAMARAVADGDLSTQLRLRAGDTQSLMANLQSMQQSLARAVTQVREGSESVATASVADRRTATRTCRAAPRSRPARCEQTAASMEELAAHRAPERRQRAPGQPAGAERRRASRSRAARWWARWSSTMKGINDSQPARSPTSSA